MADFICFKAPGLDDWTILESAPDSPDEKRAKLARYQLSNPECSFLIAGGVSRSEIEAALARQAISEAFDI